MAEGGAWSTSFKDSFSKASGDADESFCDPCKSVDEWKAAVGYCPICDEYLCENCLEVHRKQKITRAHVILDKNQMPSGQGSIGSQDVCVDICKTHHPEIVRFYCEAHDEPGCGDCMTLNHTACKKDRIQDISGGFEKTAEFKDINQHLQQLHQDLKDMEGELDNNLKNLETTYNQVLQKIASARQKLNEYLDHIQKKVTDKAAQMQKEDEKELKTLQAENQAMKTEIKDMLGTLHDSNVNVNSIFVTTKQAKQRLVTMEKEMNEIKQSQQQQQQQYEFHISNELENIVSAKTQFGKLSRKPSQTRREMPKKQYQKMPRTSTIGTTIASYNRSINVKCKADQKNCFISSCTLLSPDRMVVTDEENKNIKLIDISNNTVISSYSMSTSVPCSVTALSANMIAVTLPGEGKIQVLTVTSTFILQRDIKVNKSCAGIAYKDGKFAVSYVKPGRVDILDIQGNLLHTIQPKQDDNYILQSPFYIIFAQDNDTVIVSDLITNKISVVTFRGQILHSFTHDKLNISCGMVITEDGVMFVCSLCDECIHVVSPDFKTSKIIINKDTHVVDPRSITYCGINHRLYISNAFTDRGDLYNQIQVYDLKVPVET